MKKLLKTIAIVTGSLIAVNTNAQMTLSKNLPTVGTMWDAYGKMAFNSNMPTPPSPSFGSTQTWDYESVYNHASMGSQSYSGQFEVVALSSIAQQDLDSAATATYAVKFTSAGFVPDMLYFYEDFGDSLYQIASKQGTNPTQPNVLSDMSRLFVFNTPINASMIIEGAELKYVGDGTLKVGGFTFNNLALLESLNLPYPNTRQFSFYQTTPHFQLVARFTFNDSTKNIIMNIWAPSGTIGAPAAPSNLTATPVNSIELNWQDNSNNEDGFYVESTQDTVAGSWTQIATVGADVTTYLHTGLTNGVTYYYRVRAYNGNGSSSWSNVAGATDGATGISSFNKNEFAFDIYPNPAKETVIIGNLPISSTLNITDIAGKTVYSSVIINEQTIISTTEFVNGVYIIQVTNNGAVGTRKLVVNK